MKKKRKKIILFRKRWLKYGITIFFVLSILIFSYSYFYYVYYRGKFYPGFKIGQQSIAGKTYQEVLGILENFEKDLNDKGLRFNYEKDLISVMPDISSPEDPSFTYKIIEMHNKETLDKAYRFGRDGHVFSNFSKHLTALISGVQVKISYDLNEKELLNILRRNFSKYEDPAENAHLQFKEEEEIFEKIPEKEGMVFAYLSIIKEVKRKIENLDNSIFYLSLVKDEPAIKLAETERAYSQIEQVLDLFPIFLTYNEAKWEISKKEGSRYLDFALRKGKVTLGFSEEFSNFLKNNIAPEIDQEVKEGRFTMNNGRVVEFQASQDGRSLNLAKSLEKIEKEVIDNQKKEVDLVVDIIKPAVTTESINNLGIKELVGRGESNFRGSPPNRRHNIAIGAKELHGLLIKPGEEFSLVKALGEIDASKGYRPELVIKGNKTVPEYGGGLCQIATTAFRLALNTGLPITERRPHSYRVSYYEPAGMDATVYNPSPDLKFINDTGHYLLWQSKIQGDDLIFEFYGTKDGRQVEVTKPTLSHYVSPPPKKIIESEDLKPGEVKCTEKAHTGATAVFYRTITYTDGNQKKETWRSVYKPWQEVCLVGKAE